VSAPLVPSHDHDVHLVLCDFGEHGTAYVETDPTNADRNAVIRTLLAGEYDRPISVIAFNRSRNGNYTNGEWTAEAIEEWRWLPSLVRAFAKTGAGR
jgi:hypothetical protein